MDGRKRRKQDFEAKGSKREKHDSIDIVNYMVAAMEETEMTQESEQEFVVEECVEGIGDPNGNPVVCSVDSNNMCNVCHRITADPQRHTEIHAKFGEMEPYSCELCGKEYGRRAHLVRHVKAHSDERPFNCSYCPKKFLYKSHVTNHEMIHTGERPHRCVDCGKCFRGISTFITHRRRHTGEKPFKCDKCDKLFISSTLLRQHAETHDGACPCTLCGKSFASERYMYKHIKRVHSNPDVVFLKASDGLSICQKCGLSFESEDLMQKHVESHRFVKCHICNREFLESTLTQHIWRKHQKDAEDMNITPNRTFHCEHCGKEYFAQSSWAYHVGGQKNASKLSLSCDICQEKFPCKTKLKQHKAAHGHSIIEFFAPKNPTVSLKKGPSRKAPSQSNGDAEKRDERSEQVEEGETSGELNSTPSVQNIETKSCVCPICGKEYKSIISMGKHLQTAHYNPYVKFVKGYNGKFICQKCKASFETEKLVEEHIESHRYVTCKVCEKEVISENRFDHMLRKHPERAGALGITPKKEYPCDICGKVFFAPSSWTRHVGLQTTKDDNPLVCVVCKKTFLCKGQVKKHMLIHSTEKDDGGPSNKNAPSQSSNDAQKQKGSGDMEIILIPVPTAKKKA